jgi:tRNA(fMet)-specific endonuclease VapC
MRDLLLDTNTLNYILRKRPPVLQRLAEARKEGCRFLLAPIAHYELTRYLRLKQADRLLRLYSRLVNSWLPCEMSFEDWSSAALLWADLHRAGKSASDLDLLLATLARKHGAVLVTSNIRHFEGLRLLLEDWTKPLAPP